MQSGDSPDGMARARECNKAFSLFWDVASLSQSPCRKVFVGNFVGNFVEIGHFQRNFDKVLRQSWTTKLGMSHLRGSYKRADVLHRFANYFWGAVSLKSLRWVSPAISTQEIVTIAIAIRYTAMGHGLPPDQFSNAVAISGASPPANGAAS